jgi:8-oxo-dGTP diphosphatase
MVPTLELSGVIARNQNGAILLVHRNTPKRKQWEIPGGKVEDEPAAHAACREFHEELGVTARVVRLLGTCTFPEDGYNMSYWWFLAEILDGEPRPREADIHDRCAYFTMHELAAMPDTDLSASLRLFMREVARGTVRL